MSRGLHRTIPSALRACRSRFRLLSLDIDRILHEPLGSLKELIESSREFSASPELFCFGLLASFDLKQVAGLVAPRPVELHRASDRAKAELTGK